MKKTMWKKRVFSFLIVAALVLSIFAYTTFTIDAEIDETNIVVTKEEIPPRTEITKEMIQVITVPSRGIPKGTIKKEEDVLGKWTVAGYGISSNSFIYDDKVVYKSELPDSGILNLKENEVAIPLLVDLETSLGNSIIPNTTVDLYFRAISSDDEKSKEKAIYGKMASQVRVVAVKDADASNVFDPEGYQQGVEQKDKDKQQPSLAKIYIFAVPEDLNVVLNKAKLLGEVVPVATGKSYVEDAETVLDENEVIRYIQSATYEDEEGKKKESES